MVALKDTSKFTDLTTQSQDLENNLVLVVSTNSLSSLVKNVLFVTNHQINQWLDLDLKMCISFLRLHFSVTKMLPFTQIDEGDFCV